MTGFPEILGGRVKTLHPHIHGGILADKDNPEHLAVLKEKGIKAFDLICVNLYDFESALAKGLKPREAIEEIDIGGPCMLRAASKNFHSILVLSDPDTYAEATAELKANDMSVFPAFPGSAGPPVRSPRPQQLRRDDRRISHEELEWDWGRERAFLETAPLFPKPARGLRPFSLPRFLTGGKAARRKSRWMQGKR